RVQLANLDQSLTLQADEKILRRDTLGSLSEPCISCENSQCGGLAQALCTFEHRHRVHLATWLQDARDHSDNEASTNSGGVLRLDSAETSRQELLKPLSAVPGETAQPLLRAVATVCVRCDVHSGIDRL